MHFTMSYSSVFGVDYHLIRIGIVLCLLLWGCAEAKIDAALWRRLNYLVCVFSLCLILFFTVWKRTSSDVHTLVFALPESGDFIREMVMNAVLFFPLGLCLSSLIGFWSVAVAFALSLGIEAWQYATGCGTAQGTDLIMNVIGAFLGTLHLFKRSSS